MTRIAVVALFLTGCATSSAGLERSNVEATLHSTKTPQAWATCVAESMIGNTQLRNDGDHYWVLRISGYGIPYVRWDFRPEGSGSRAELRASFGYGRAEDRVRACA